MTKYSQSDKRTQSHLHHFPAVSICKAWVIITLLFAAASSCRGSHAFGWFSTAVTSHISIIQAWPSSPLSFSAFLLVKAQVSDWGPHHTSSRRGLLPPFPLTCRGRETAIFFFFALVWQKALNDRLSTLRALSFPLTHHPHSSSSLWSWSRVHVDWCETIRPTCVQPKQYETRVQCFFFHISNMFRLQEERCGF